MATVLKQTDFIADTRYSYKWLVEMLSENDEVFTRRYGNSKISKITYHEIGEGSGYSSKLHRIDVHFEGEGRPHTVAIKIPQVAKYLTIFKANGYPATAEKMLTVVSFLYKREVDVYKKLGDCLTLPIPRTFAVEDLDENHGKGVVLMEYLAKNGAMLGDLQRYNIGQIISLTKVAVQLAAVSLTRGKAFVEQFPMSLPVLDSWIMHLWIAAKKAAEMRPEAFEAKIDRLKPLYASSRFLHYGYTGISKELGIPPVLIHSDLLTKNVFWKKTEDGKCSNEVLAVIDWQIAHTGAIGEDLVTFLVLCTDTKTRRLTEQWIFDYFHALLKSELNSKGLQMPYTVEQIKAAYRRSLVRQTLFFISLVVQFELENTENGKKAKEKEEFWSRMSAAADEAIYIAETELPQFLS